MTDIRTRPWLGLWALACWSAACGGDSHPTTPDTGKRSSTEAPSTSAANPNTQPAAAPEKPKTDPSTPAAQPSTPANAAAAGGAAPAMPAANSGMPMTATDPTKPNPSGMPKGPAKDECGLNTGYP